MSNENAIDEITREIPRDKLLELHETIFYAILKRTQDINYIVRQSAIQMLQDISECTTHNLNFSGDTGIDCFQGEEYVNCIKFVIDRIYDKNTNVVRSALRCLASLIKNNIFYEDTQKDGFNEKQLISMINQETVVLKEFCDPDTFDQKYDIMIGYVQALELINKNKLLPN